MYVSNVACNVYFMCVLLIIIFCYSRMRFETLSNVKNYFSPLLFKKKLLLLISFFIITHLVFMECGIFDVSQV